MCYNDNDKILNLKWRTILSMTRRVLLLMIGIIQRRCSGTTSRLEDPKIKEL